MKNKNTQKELEKISNHEYYKRRGYTWLTQVYKTASCYKWRAFYDCLDFAKKHNTTLYIGGANCCRFTCSCDYYENGKHMLAYFTAYNTYIFEIY